jgi:hypothetical protein
VLARSGLSVVVLERDMRAVDRVRGEFMVPWGVTEAASLASWIICGVPAASMSRA